MKKLDIQHPRTVRQPRIIMVDTGMTAAVSVMSTSGEHTMFLRENEVAQVFDWCKAWLKKGLIDAN